MYLYFDACSSIQTDHQPADPPTHTYTSDCTHQGRREHHICTFIGTSSSNIVLKTMLFHKKVIILLVVQSAAFLAGAFVTPSPFGLSTPKSCSIAGPLLVSAVEDESAEAVVEETGTVLEVPESDAAEDQPEESSDEAAAAAEKQRLTVFVGNLPFQTTDSEVRDLFAEFGTVDLVSVPRNRETGQARGFAFVDMATREDLDKAIAGVNGLMYGGRTIRVAESLPKDQVVKESTTKKVAPEEGVRKIYVGNLSFDADKESLIEFYSQYGTVKDIYIPVDVGTGRGRGFAFVTMAEEDVDRAIQNTNGAEFMGRLLSVSIPLPRGTKAAPRPAPRDGESNNSGGTKLYVGNLSFYTTLEAIQDLFGEYGEVMDCYLPQDRDSGGSRGFAFVTLDREGAMRAMEETDGYELDGRIIRVNEAEPRGRTPRRNDYYDEEVSGEEYSDTNGSEY